MSEEGDEVLDDEEYNDADNKDDIAAGFQNPYPILKTKIIPDKPLTEELAARCLSLLQRIGYGYTHAFIKFNCVNKGITDIRVLKNFQFLRYVTLSRNYISDLSPIFAAEHLMYLKADNNRIVKAGEAKGLPYLQYIDLSHNKLLSTDNINHGRLVTLNLNYNEITTLGGIDGPPLNQFKLRALETLELRGNKITSMQGLNYLTDLKTLYLGENLLRGIDDISQMRGLVRLHLRDNNIRRLDGFLLGPPNLQYLNLRGNQISRWAETKKLSALDSLTTLVLSDNPIAEKDHYRPTVVGMIPHLQRLDKDKVTKAEQSRCVEFYGKLDKQYLDGDIEEEEVVAEGIETMFKDGEQLNEGGTALPGEEGEGGEAGNATDDEKDASDEKEEEEDEED